MRKGGTLGVLLSILVINDNDRVLTMFMLSQVGASVRAIVVSVSQREACRQ